MRRILALFSAGLALSFSLSAQELGIHTHPTEGLAYPSESLPEVHVTCDEMGWILAQENWYSNVEHPATFVFSTEAGSDTVTNVGFRLRGNTSRGAPKKSFKVSFNAFDDAQSWQGLKKMNLNGEHNDPSVMRARLSWECLRDGGVPVSRSTHVKLFINGAFYGVYSNTEHIDGEWLEKRFDHAHGNLWKCTYPANLAFVSSNPDAYKFTPSWSNQRVYELKTNNATDDYSSLAEFIDVLNNAPIAELPCALEALFDVDAYLKVAAGEILLGHWDNYIGNQNNFYLYERSTDGRIMYIPYDTDNTLGIQWFGEWTDQGIYNWTDANDRALYTRLLAVPAYRERFTWYIQWWMSDFFGADWVEARGDWLIQLLDDAIGEDTYYPQSYGFESEDFQNSMQLAWGSHVAHSPVDFANSRSFWAEIQADDLPSSTPPIVQCWVENPRIDDTLHVQCWAPELSSIEGWAFEVELDADGETSTHSLDHVGGTSHGHAWEQKVALNGAGEVFWRAHSTDPNGGEQFSPCDWTRVWNTNAASPFLLNEVMPINDGFHSDVNGNHGDWVELINAGSVPANCSGLYLSNRLMELGRWPVPSVTLEPGQHLLIWCDDTPESGPVHTNFTLAGSEDEVFLSIQDEGLWRVVDFIEWADALPDFSFGRIEDASDEWVWFNPNSTNPPTPNAMNGTPNTAETRVPQQSVALPTPCAQPCHVSLPPGTHYTMHDLSGTRVLSGQESTVTLAGLPPGCYLLTFASAHSTSTQKIILQ